MGSFDVGCGLSNLTVHCGDEAGFLILDKLPSGYGSNYDPDASTGKSFLSGSEYLPFLPPVFGVYDDYGRMRQIRASTTTQVLEKLFDRPVEVVMDCLGGMRGIYDSYGEIYKNYMLPECSAAVQYGTPVEDVLVAFGFVKDQNGNSFVYGDYELLINFQNPTAAIRDKRNGREFAKIRFGSRADDLLEAFSSHTGVYPGFSPNDYGRIRLLNRLGGMYFLEEVFTKMDKFSSAEHYMNNFHKRGMDRREKELAEFFDHLRKEKDNDFPFSGYMRFTEDLSRDVSLPMEHWRLLEAYESNADELLSIVRFSRIADSVNRVLAPTYCGEQMGDDRASLMLNHIEKQILDVRKKEYEDEINDDDDDEKYWDLGIES